jgi:shikimate dehydrogenase
MDAAVPDPITPNPAVPDPITTHVAGPRRAAVLGHPIEHSLSPVLHRAAYRELGLDWTYTACDITSADLAEFVGGLGPEWAGLSLTMPLKETVLGLLTDVEPRAAAVSAVNTVVLDGASRRGFNTDITGLEGILVGAGIGDSSTAALVGAGATARSALAALAACGVPGCAVLARRPDAVSVLVALAAELGIQAAPGAWPATAEALAADVVITTVPADVATGWPVPDRPGLLVDVLYHPWPTPFARAWEAAGGTVVGGLELLVRQAVEQVVLMTGRRPDIDAMRRAGAAALAARASSEVIAQEEQ